MAVVLSSSSASAGGQDTGIERLERQNQAMKRLVAAVQELSLARNLDAVMAVVRRAARELTGADGATFVLGDGDKCFYADEDAIEPLWKGQRFPMSACISGWTMLNRQSVVIEDIYADSRIPADAYRPTFVKSLVMVPIRPQAPIGAIGNYWARPHLATADEIDLLNALANTTAVAMEDIQLHAELEQRVQQRTAQLEEANRELEAFSYSVSHDLRGALQPVSSFAGLLAIEGEAVLGARAKDYLDRIQAETQRMAGLIGDLLRLAQFGQIELKSEKLNLSEMAREVAARLKFSAPGRPVDFVIEDHLEAQGDAGLLRVVMENLISNAWKYTSRKERARIAFGVASAKDGSKAYFVQDNGAGFDMAAADKLFAPFHRLHREEEFAGHGVGLATARRIINRHGGRIWCEAMPEKGATFYFTLDSATSPSAQNR